jgi:ribosomal protein S6--L-glutamate ligase
MNPSIDLGWEEWVSLPSINLPYIKAKVDTGAQTSVLHAKHIEVFKVKKKKFVRFEISPLPEKPNFKVSCSAPLTGRRKVTSSNGESEKRYFIKTDIEISGQTWEIEISLTDRHTMQYRMLIGRSSIGPDMTVYANESFLNGQPPTKNPYSTKKKRSLRSRRALRIALLTREPNNYTSKRIMIAGQQRGHQVEPINSTRCYLDVDTGNPEIYYDSSPLPKYDIVIPRIGASITSYGLAVTRQFQLTGALPLNDPQAIANSRDKLLAHQLLASANINMPVTGFASSPKDTMGVINTVGTMPLVIKLLESSQGKGVILAETKKAAETVINAFRGLQANFLVQEYIEESKGEDLRCLVIDGKVVGSIVRSNKDNDFRSNLHQGGVAQSTTITAKERGIAVRAAKAIGLSVAGVDILRSNRGPLVLEVNSSPGIQGIEKTLEMDIAGQIIMFCEKKLGILPN